MSSKIIRGAKTSRETPFVMRRFSDVERGEKDYIIRSFADDEEFSVQDAYSAANLEEPATITNKEDEITDRDYLPPSKLAKAENGIVGETVEMLKAFPGSDGFVESDMFCDVEEHQENYPTKVVRSKSGEEDAALSYGEAQALKEKIDALEKRVKELEAEKEDAARVLAEKDAALEAKNKEIEDAASQLPAKLEEARAAGSEEGYKRGEAEFSKKYEADRNDYLAKLDAFNKEAAAKLDEVSSTIKAIDEQISDTVLGFVKSIVGAERKLNDKFVVNLIKNNLKRLNELKDVRFTVNPVDLDTVKKELPDYVVSSDTSVEKGCVRVHSRVGEVSLDAGIMIADLERQINEELGASENS